MIREELRAAIGSFDDRSFEKAKLLVERLQSLESQQRTFSSARSSVLVEKDVSAEFEFGMDLEFKSPSYTTSRQVDEEVVDFDWDYETGQPKALMQKEQGSTTEAIFSRSPGNADMVEAKGDLRWLKDLCDKIALSGGQFSGDELAVTILHVLDSEGTGDEVSSCLL